MSIFKKNEQPAAPPTQVAAQKPRERTGSPSRGSNPDAAMSLIGAGMLVVGDILTEGTVRIEGEVRGTIRAGKSVVLGQGGHVEGDIITADAIIGGTIHGTIVAGHRLELQSTCSVNGEIQTRPEHLKLDEGARFAGQVQMLDAAAAEIPAPELTRAEVREDGTNGHPSDARRPRTGETVSDGEPLPLPAAN